MIDTDAMRDKWSQWEDAALDPQTLRADFLDVLDEIDRLREERNMWRRRFWEANGDKYIEYPEVDRD